MAFKSFEAIVTVLDKASEPLRRAEERSMLLHKRLLQLGEVSGLRNLAEAGRGLEARMARMSGLATRLTAPLLAIGGAAGGFGLGETINKAAELGEKLHLATQRTGVGTQQLSGWFYAARQAGVDTDSLTKSLEHLSNVRVAAASGKNPLAALILNRAGLAHVKGKAAEMLPQIADEVKSLEDRGQHDVAEAMLKQLFGREGDELLPMMREGSLGLAQAMADAAQHGMLFDPGKVETLDKLHKSMLNLRFAVEGFGTAIAVKLGPHLEKMMDKFSLWLDKLQKNKDFNDFLDRFGTALERIDWDNIGAVFDRLGKALAKISGFFGGDGSIVDGAMQVAEIMGGLWLAKMLWPINKFIGAAADAAIKAGAIGKNLFSAGAAAEAATAASTAGRMIGTALGAGIVGGLGAALVVGAKTGLDALARSLGLPSDNEAADDYWQHRNEDRTPSWLRWAELKNWFGDGPFGGAHAGGSTPFSGSNTRSWWQRLGDFFSPAAYTIGSALQRAQERQESGGRQFDRNGNPLTSRAGAVGVMQLLPSTARGVARSLGEALDVGRLFTDAGYNRRLGQIFMRQLLQEFHGSVPEALAAYNWGPGRVERSVRRWGEGGFLAHAPLETQRYVESILRHAGDLGSGGSEAKVIIEHRNVPASVHTHVETRGNPNLIYSDVGMAFAP